MKDWGTLLALLALFLPLCGAFAGAMGIFFTKMKTEASFASAGLVFLSAIGADFLLREKIAGLSSFTLTFSPWLKAGDFSAVWAFRFDTLSIVMAAVVTTVSAFIHLYSLGYMKTDKGLARFMSFISLFTFLMLLLVTSDNLLQMFLGWEGVGLCSYLLINFWFEKESANKAGMKAFLVNRVGDIGFVLGIFGCFYLFKSVAFADIFAQAPSWIDTEINLAFFSCDTLTLLCLAFFLAAVGKSAQLGLHIWLPDAMEGPTPVSALIHAATMVTAGVFLVARLSPLYQLAPDALKVVAVMGGATAFFAATIALAQNDIKRVIAYSTMSQLGMMIFATGLGAYAAALFHLATHAFFKALLFLGAGSVIHALHGEQDMRQMGGLRQRLRGTYALMWCGALSLAGVGVPSFFGFSGFYSKDLILELAAAQGAGGNDVAQILFFLGVGTAFLTALYMGRLMFLVFHGDAHHPQLVADAHEAPSLMMVPMIVLGIASVFLGFFFKDFVTDAEFWAGSLAGAEQTAPHLEGVIRFVPLIACLSGLAIAAVLYGVFPATTVFLSRHFGAVHRALAMGYGLDTLLARRSAKLAFHIGEACAKTGDASILDGFFLHKTVARIQKTGAYFSRAQTGYVYHYAFVMVAGLVLLTTWYWIGG